MKTFSLVLGLTAGLSASLASASSLLTVREAPTDKSALEERVDRRPKDVQEMKKFLRAYGVELVREQISEMHGEIHGKVEGKVNGIMLGNLAHLLTGIAGLGANLVTTPYHAMMSTAMPLGSALSQLAGGLQGMGFMRGKLSGSLAGEVNGSGYQINHEASSFYVIGLDRDALKEEFAFLNAQRAKGYLPGNDGEFLQKIAANPYFPTPAQVADFRLRSVDLTSQFDTIQELLVANVGANDSFYSEVSRLSNELKSWASAKRITIAMARPQVEFELKSDFAFDSAKAQRFACGTHYVEAFSRQIPKIKNIRVSNWRKEIVAALNAQGFHFNEVNPDVPCNNALAVSPEALYKATSTYFTAIKSDGAPTIANLVLHSSTTQVQENVRLVQP